MTTPYNKMSNREQAEHHLKVLRSPFWRARTIGLHTLFGLVLFGPFGALFWGGLSLAVNRYSIAKEKEELKKAGGVDIGG